MTLVIPKQYEYLTQTKKIPFKGRDLKTISLLHLIDYIIKESTNDDKTFHLYSVLQKSLYGKYYCLYIEYLIETGLIQKVGKYSTFKHLSNQYKLKDDLSEVIICRENDYVLEKKLSKYYSSVKLDKIDSPIPIDLRKKLVDDLYSITIDYDQSLSFIHENLKNNPRKYNRNLSMINKIKDGELFFHFDPYGRLHTNFTNLKSEIRNNFLKKSEDNIGITPYLNLSLSYYWKFVKCPLNAFQP